LFTILILEDDSVIRKVLAKRLSGENNFLIFIEHAECGYEIARLNKIDLFIIDIGLPGNINGIDFYKTIRGLTKYLEAPAIITSVDRERLNLINNDRHLAVVEKNGNKFIKEIMNIIEATSIE